MNKRIKSRNRSIKTESKLMVARGEVAGYAKWVKGSERYKLPVMQSSHRSKRHSAGNTISDTAIVLCVVTDGSYLWGV